MEDKKKKRSPKPCLTQPAQAPGTLRRVPVPTSHSGSLALGLPHLPSPKQRAKFKRAGKEKCRPVLAGGGGGSAGTPLQHSFLTEVTDVYEMEGGLLNLLNDFHSGRLQAFGKECSFEQLEHVREMQEKLARLHFSLDVCGEEEDEEEEEDGVTEGLPEEQKKTMADRNLDQLLSNLEDLSNSIQKLHLAENAEPEDQPAAVGEGGRTRMRASDGEAQRVSLETRVGPYVCACPGAALSEDSLRKRTQASDAQRRAVGEEMDPDLFLRKVSTLQAGFRGFLVRRQFQSLRAEYEAIVQEIEGDLSTLQWTGGWIPKPVFLPEAKSHQSWKAEKISNPEQKLWSHSPHKDSEKELIWEEMVQKKTEKSPANPGSLCRDDSAWPQAEQGRKASQGNSQDTSVSKMENADLGLSQSQQELQEQRNHLAMELLWLQQAINSRKEYLILKQTLRSPEASQTRDKHRGQAYEKTSLHSSCVLDNQSYRDRIIGESHHAEDSSHKGRLKPQKHPDSVTSAGKTTAGSKGRELCYRNSASQLPAALESQAGGDRVTKGPDHGGQPFKETSLQQLKVLEDQIPGDLKFRSPCSRKAETQLPTLSENQNIEDRYSRKPSRSAGPCDLNILEGHMIWDETLAGQEQGSLDLIRTKPPKSQPPSAGSSGHGNTSELSPEGWKNRGILQWR